MGNKFREARLLKGLTQQEAADLIGIRRETLISWEQSEEFPKAVQILTKMSDVYDIPISDFLYADNINCRLIEGDRHENNLCN